MHKSLLSLIIIIAAVFPLLAVSSCSEIGKPGEGNEIDKPVSGIGPIISGKINGEDYLFVAVSYYSPVALDILILDLKNPAQPERLALLKAPAKYVIRDLKLNGSILYASTIYNLRIIDVSNPADPREMASMDDIQAFNMAISGQHAYLIEQNKQITIADISAPESPQVINTMPIRPRPPRKMQVTNSRLLWSIDEGIQIMDSSIPASPKELGFILDTAYLPPVKTPWRVVPPEETGLVTQRFKDYAVQGDTVYVASGQGGLKIYDISDPANPHQIATFKASENPGSDQISVSGNRAYLFEKGFSPEQTNSLYILDISELSNPQKLRLIELSFNNVYHGFVETGSYVYAFGIYPASSSGPNPPGTTPFFEIIDTSSGVVSEVVLR